MIMLTKVMCGQLVVMMLKKGETSSITKELKPGEVKRQNKVYVINKEKFDTGKWYVVVNNEYKEQIK